MTLTEPPTRSHHGRPIFWHRLQWASLCGLNYVTKAATEKIHLRVPCYIFDRMGLNDGQ